MTGVFADLSMRGLGPVLMMLNGLGDPSLQADGLASIGGLVENQTKGRFSERTAPDGTPWAPWSKAYAATRRAGQSLLVAGGDLRDSIAWELDADELRVGSNLVYAAIQQFGGLPGMAPGPAAIPGREYLGLSDANIAEIEDALSDWIGETLH